MSNCGEQSEEAGFNCRKTTFSTLNTINPETVLIGLTHMKLLFGSFFRSISKMFLSIDIEKDLR